MANVLARMQKAINISPGNGLTLCIVADYINISKTEKI